MPLAHLTCVYDVNDNTHKVCCKDENINLCYNLCYKVGVYMRIQERLKALANEQQITLKDIILKAGLNYNNIINKFSRGTIRVCELERILDALGYELIIKPKDK